MSIWKVTIAIATLMKVTSLMKSDYSNKKWLATQIRITSYPNNILYTNNYLIPIIMTLICHHKSIHSGVFL